MSGKAAITLVTGLEDTERVTVALWVAGGAAESGRPTLVFSPRRPPGSRSGASPSAPPARSVPTSRA